jgi:hypothetical protein
VSRPKPSTARGIATQATNRLTAYAKKGPTQAASYRRAVKALTRSTRPTR